MRDSPPAITWAIEGVLAECYRPGYPAARPHPEAVRQWVQAALDLGVRSVLCILDAQEMAVYNQIGLEGGGLVGYYRSRGLEAAHIPARDKIPPLSPQELGQVWEAYQALEPPVLVHCNAGINRTNAAVVHILRRLRQEGRFPSSG